MRLILKEHNVWTIVNRDEDMPPRAGLGANPAQVAMANNERRNYGKREDKAMSLIGRTIHQSLIYLVSHLENSAEVWEALEHHFRQRTDANRMDLITSLSDLKLKPGGDIREHVRKAKEYADELATIGQQLAELDRVIYLLKGLPKEYEMLITAWRAQADLPGWDVVVRRLQETHDMLKRNKTSSFNGKVKEEEPEERSFYTRQQRGRGGSRGQSRRITCYECGQDGHRRRNCTRQRSCFQCGSTSHLRRNCPRNNQQNRGSRGNNNSNRNSRPNSERNRAAMSHEEEEYMTAWMVSDQEQDSSSATFTSQIKNNGEWLIDSGATRHMTASKELFTSLKKLENPTTVKVANGENLKAIGIGEIELEAGGGLRSPARLTETLYVPGDRKSVV